MKANSCNTRLSSLEQAKSVLITLKQRMSFTLATPKELLEELCNNTRFNDCRYLHIAESLYDKYGFEEAWKKALFESEQAFQREDIQLINQLGSILGRCDLSTQQQQMEQILQQLDEIIKRAEKQNDDKRRMYLSLGTLAGFMSAVLLI